MKQIDAITFDAYHKWLAIPPHEQPPNHYRLLGVELFEEDLDVIATAADRQMAHVKCFISGKYASHSQRLLNELAAARICLLNPEQKARYDMQLKQQSLVSQPAEPFSPPPALEINVLPLRSYTYRSKSNKRRKSLPVIVFLIVGGAMGLLAGYGALSLIKQNQVGIQTTLSPKHVPKTEPPPSQPLRRQLQRPGARERGFENTPDGRDPIPEVNARRRPPPIPNLEDRTKRREQEPEAPEPAEPREGEESHFPQPSIVVPLTLDEPKILVLATPVDIEVKDIQCDIGLSQNLLRNIANPNVHEIVVARLGNRGTHTAEFATRVPGCQVGLDISINHHSSTVACDIRPRFSLPSGEVQPFTIRDLDKQQKILTKLQSKVQGAKSSLSRLQATHNRELERVADARNALAMLARGGNPATAANARAAAQAQLLRAEAAVLLTEKKMAEARNWIGKEHVLQNDQRALESVSAYANQVATVGSIYIRFYAGETTIPATLK